MEKNNFVDDTQKQGEFFCNNPEKTIDIQPCDCYTNQARVREHGRIMR